VSFGLKDVAGLAAAALADHGRQPVDHSAIATRVATVTICTLLAMGFGFAAFTCASVALWIVLVPYLGSVAATLVIAAVLLAACLAMVLLARNALRPKSNPMPSAASQFPTEQLLAQGSQLVKEHKGAMLLAALVAGMVAADGKHI